jgi:hypothetical protein
LPQGSQSLPILIPPKDPTIPKLPIPKKDKLKKGERELAEKHFTELGALIRQLERTSDSHNLYLPRSSYFPSHILSPILDQLLVIHFPAQLEDIVKKSWLHYPKYKDLLFDSVITIQVLIKAQRTNKQQTANAKKTNGQRQPTNIVQNEDDSRSASPDLASDIEEPVNPSTTRKRAAAEDITNTAKRRRAPRAIQPSVAQVSEDFGPKYRTRRRAIVPGVSSESAEKENEPQATRTSLRLRGRN